MAAIIVCDRCGGTLSENETSVTGKEAMRGAHLSDRPGASSRHFDLCESCFVNVELYIQTPPDRKG